jgi:flagellar hook-length control protein FliK
MMNATSLAPSTATAAPQTGTASTGTQTAPTDFLTLFAQIVAPSSEEAAGALPAFADDAATRDSELELPTDAAQLVPWMQALLVDSERLGGALPRQADARTSLLDRVSQATLDGRTVATLSEAQQASGEAAAADTELFSMPVSVAENASHAKAQAAADPTRPIHTPVGNAQWADELGARLTTLTEQGRYTASLRLAPEHLGPLEVRIAVQDDQVTVWFGAAHADTRAAIEHALPRLREMFAAQGMSLADAGVFHEAPREHAQHFAPPGVSADRADASFDEREAAPARVAMGLVDAYA